MFSKALSPLLLLASVAAPLSFLLTPPPYLWTQKFWSIYDIFLVFKIIVRFWFLVNFIIAVFSSFYIINSLPYFTFLVGHAFLNIWKQPFFFFLFSWYPIYINSHLFFFLSIWFLNVSTIFVSFITWL